MSQAERIAQSLEPVVVERPAWRLGDLSESSRWAYYLLLPSLLLVAAVAVYPLASGVWLSFQRYNLLGAPTPSFVGLAQYVSLWTDSVFWTAARNTVVWVTAGAGSQFLLGLIVALALNRPRLRGIGLLRIGLLLPWLMPTVVAGHMWSLLLDSRLGVVNDLLVRVGVLHNYVAWFAQAETALGAVLVVDLWKNFPFFTLLLLAGLQGVPEELYEAAEVDDKGQPAMDRQKATDALRWYTELFTKYKAVPASVTNDSFQQIMTGFTTGQTAMLWHHTGSLIDVGTALGADSGKFGTQPMPAGPGAHIGSVSYSYNGMSDPKNAEADWAWLDHWAQPDTQITFLESTGYFPSSTKVVDDPRIQKNPYYAAAIETLEFGGPPPAFAGSSNWGSTVVLPNFQRVLLGEIKPEEAVDVMMKGLDKAVKG